MTTPPVEVVEAGERLMDGEIDLMDYLDLLLDYRYINQIDIAVVDMLSNKTGEPMRKSEVAELLGSDLKYIKRCVRRVTDVLTMFDDTYEETAFDIIGVAVGRLIQ